MVRVANLLATVDKQSVLATLRATGSRDPDVLYAQKLTLLAAAKSPLIAGTALMVAGVLASITIILAPAGIPVAVVGWKLRRRGVANLSNVHDGFAEYINHDGH